MCKRYRSVLLSTMIALLVLSACSAKIQHHNRDYACDTKALVIKAIQNEQGTFLIEEGTGRATVQVHKPGTIDEVAIYRICNPPAHLPKNNVKVTFSGKVRAGKEVATLGGYKYYELQIGSLTAL